MRCRPLASFLVLLTVGCGTSTTLAPAQKYAGAKFGIVSEVVSHPKLTILKPDSKLGVRPGDVIDIEAKMEVQGDNIPSLVFASIEKDKKQYMHIVPDLKKEDDGAYLLFYRGKAPDAPGRYTIKIQCVDMVIPPGSTAKESTQIVSGEATSEVLVERPKGRK